MIRTVEDLQPAMRKRLVHMMRSVAEGTLTRTEEGKWMLDYFSTRAHPTDWCDWCNVAVAMTTTSQLGPGRLARVVSFLMRNCKHVGSLFNFLSFARMLMYLPTANALRAGLSAVRVHADSPEGGCDLALTVILCNVGVEHPLHPLLLQHVVTALCRLSRPPPAFPLLVASMVHNLDHAALSWLTGHFPHVIAALPPAHQWHAFRRRTLEIGELAHFQTISTPEHQANAHAKYARLVYDVDCLGAFLESLVAGQAAAASAAEAAPHQQGQGQQGQEHHASAAMMLPSIPPHLAYCAYC